MSAGFGKRLAHTDKKVRDQAVTALIDWLKTRTQSLSDLELLKLWKGLFYAFWMSDKPRIQEHLAEKLASVALELPVELSLRYIESFWSTMAAEWHGIDRLRLDKFYLLMRKFHQQAHVMLKSTSWDSDVVASFVEVMKKGPLSLERSEPTSSTNQILLDKVIAMFNTLFSRAASADESYLLPINAVGRYIFKVAAAETTPPKNRRLAYDLYENISKLHSIDITDVINGGSQKASSAGKDSQKSLKRQAPVPAKAFKKAKLTVEEAEEDEDEDEQESVRPNLVKAPTEPIRKLALAKKI
ncbi:hypothetical protein HDU76_003686, partial [Blyttiomyces sp. JEL0837]